MSELVNKIIEIADAIRTKKNTTEKIPLVNFPSEILSIETKSDPVISKLTVTENGTYTVPDGTDGYNPVVVNVSTGGGGGTGDGTGRPSDWMYLPTPQEMDENTLYILLNLLPNGRNNLNFSCNYYDIEKAYVEIGYFDDNKNWNILSSRSGNYACDFCESIEYPTNGGWTLSDGTTKQLAIKTTNRDITSMAFSKDDYGNSANKCIKEIRGNLPKSRYWNVGSDDMLGVPTSMEFFEVLGTDGYSEIFTFQNCTSLKYVTFFGTESSMLLQDFDFYGCSSLEKLETTIDSNMRRKSNIFVGCTNLKSIKLKVEQQSITYCEVFYNNYGLTSLEEVEIEGDGSIYGVQYGTINLVGTNMTSAAIKKMLFNPNMPWPDDSNCTIQLGGTPAEMEDDEEMEEMAANMGFTVVY